MGVARGPNAKDILTIAPRQCHSHSLIFLIDSTQPMILRPSIRGHLVVLWFFSSTSERLSGVGVSTFIVP